MRKRSKYKKTVYGRDDYRARSGPEYEDPGSGFAPNRDYAGSGYSLKKVRGRFLDKLSIEEIEDDEAAIRETRKQTEATSFLARMGFIKDDGSTLK